ncbi:hypothetical protein [Rhizohabitans arisaemae]|uniref:hypothetical protein n=1 Tax=Rhizohabitans arisaemae TaxID=2720610 RepID=UPI0024B26AD6|nr:hypothetical protein [Rhizohabitans arisaemae]
MKQRMLRGLAVVAAATAIGLGVATPPASAFSWTLMGPYYEYEECLTVRAGMLASGAASVAVACHFREPPMVAQDGYYFMYRP